jgi:tetratricopeptide (TPR) repeat protein
VVELRGDLAEEAEAVYRDLIRERPDDPELVRLAADCTYLRVWSLVTRDRRDEAVELLRSSVESLEPWIAVGSHEVRAAHAIQSETLARITSNGEQQAEALGRIRALVDERPDDLVLWKHLLNGLNWSSMRRRQTGEVARGRAELDEATALARGLVERSADHDSRLMLAGLVMLHGYWEWLEGRFGDAVGPFEESLELHRAILEEDRTREDARFGAVESGVSLAGVLGALRRAEDAGFALQDVEEDLEWLRGQYPGDVRYEHQEVQFLHNRAVSLELQGRHEEARDDLTRAVAILEERVREWEDPREAPYTLGMVLLSLSKEEHTLDGAETALASIERAQALFEAAHAAVPDDPDVRSWLLKAGIDRGRLLLALDRPAEAAEALASDVPRAEQRTDRLVQNLECLLDCLARARALGDPEVVRRCKAAAGAALSVLRERGGFDQLPAVTALQGALELE